MPRTKGLGRVMAAAAVILAAASVWTAVTADAPDWHGVIGEATVITAVWALLRHYCGQRRAGGRWVSDEERVVMEQTLARGIAEGLSTPGAGEAGERRPQPMPSPGAGRRSAP